MKTMLAIAAAALIVGGLHFQHSTTTAGPVRGTWSGEITSNHCGAMHAHGMTAQECTRQCVKDGAEYVLLSKGAIYRFANQDDPQLDTLAGAGVTVSGELTGSTLTVFSMEGRQ